VFGLKIEGKASVTEGKFCKNFFCCMCVFRRSKHYHDILAGMQGLQATLDLMSSFYCNILNLGIKPKIFNFNAKLLP